jgi:hypothetical protein
MVGDVRGGAARAATDERVDLPGAARIFAPEEIRREFPGFQRV